MSKMALKSLAGEYVQLIDPWQRNLISYSIRLFIPSVGKSIYM